jgi:hypothetical protein
VRATCGLRTSRAPDSAHSLLASLAWRAACVLQTAGALQPATRSTRASCAAAADIAAGPR